MSKPHWAWKPVAIFIVAATALIVALPLRSTPSIIFAKVGNSLCALALLQFAFGWPRLPVLLWRIFGPL